MCYLTLFVNETAGFPVWNRSENNKNSTTKIVLEYLGTGNFGFPMKINRKINFYE